MCSARKAQTAGSKMQWGPPWTAAVQQWGATALPKCHAGNAFYTTCVQADGMYGRLWWEFEIGSLTTLQSLNWLAGLSACVLAMEHQLKLQQTRCLQRATCFFESPLKSWGPLSTSGEILRWCPCLFLSTEFRSCNIRPKKKWSCPDVSLFTIV